MKRVRKKKTMHLYIKKNYAAHVDSYMSPTKLTFAYIISRHKKLYLDRISLSSFFFVDEERNRRFQIYIRCIRNMQERHDL